MSENDDGISTEETIAIALNAIVSSSKVKQAFMVVLTEDDEIVRTKGHFYDNATLLNSILGDLKEKIYLEIFSGPKPRN